MICLFPPSAPTKTYSFYQYKDLPFYGILMPKVENYAVM